MLHSTAENVTSDIVYLNSERNTSGNANQADAGSDSKESVYLTDYPVEDEVWSDAMDGADPMEQIRLYGTIFSIVILTFYLLWNILYF